MLRPGGELAVAAPPRPRRALGVVALALLAAACGTKQTDPPPRAATPPAGAVAARQETRPNLVLFVVDTLRADHLGCYGYDRPTSPRLDEFAREGVRFAEARAQSSWTKPAMATILTGLYPVTHGAERRANGIAPEVRTLAERLSAAGYETAMFTTNPTVVEKFGFGRGFDRFEYVHQLQGRKRRSVDSAAMVQAGVAWLDGRAAPERPFFLVVHTLDPHDPYRPQEPYRSRFAPGVDVASACCFRGGELAALSAEQAATRRRDSLALYDGEIAQNDASFGRLLDDLRARGLLDRSAVVFTADHGEEFHEHGGWRHAESLFEEVLRVPLVVRLPKGTAARATVADPADQIDLAPTLLELAGVAAPPELPGASLLPVIAGGAAPPRESLAWLRHPAFDVAAIRDGNWKWLRHEGALRSVSGGFDNPVEALYDLEADPGEQRNLLAAEPDRRRALALRVKAARARFARAHPGDGDGEVAIDPELDAELRALGYL
jgi:arylsulfatase A-like enzyme